ncbi:MAG: SBBP repeat-containing protein [Dehalococcoidia bacterium]|jgi:hypothetical protein
MPKLLNVCMLLLILALMCPASLPVQASIEPDNTFLQFTGGGHVLGFTQDGMYAAAGDHALKVEFVSGSMVQPVSSIAANGQNKVSPLDKVTYSVVWKDIDIAYTSAANGIAESTYYLNTPASVESIRLRYNRPVSLDSNGNLVISFENGNMTESTPIAWQEIEGSRKAVSANYVIYGDKEIGFALADCQPGIPVVIDPTLTWTTTLPGNENVGISIAVDSSGNVYIGGYSHTTWGTPVRAYYADDNADVFVAKLNSNGVLQWNTFLGGAGDDEKGTIALDSSGNIYIAGQSHNSWQGDSAPVRAFTISPDGMDVFAAKLNNNGVLQWNTFLGGSGNDECGGIAVDTSGYIYVAGTSDATWQGDNPPRQAFTAGNQDAFAAKLNNNGALQWNTFLGGSDYTHGSAIAVDSTGNIYIAGDSNASWGSPLRAYKAGNDAFAARLNNNGDLQWNTFLGGSLNDYSSSIATDTGGNVYIAGDSEASWGSPLRAHNTGSNPDAFAAKLNSSGALVWNTFLGGSDGNAGNGIAVNSSGNIYVTGYSTSTWGSPVWAYTASMDVLLAKLNNNGALQWNTFLGGTGDDSGGGIAVDTSGNIYIAGCFNLTWVSGDAFATKILADPPTITSFTPTSGDSGTKVIITGTNFTGATAVSFGGMRAASFIVNSDTQITATTGTGTTGRITVKTSAGTATSAANFNFDSQIGTTPHGSSMSGVTAATPQGPVSLPSVSVKSASLSATKVAPGATVTVTADVANTGTVNGTSSIKVYVNGELENSQGITVNSGSSTPVTFTVTRNEPGTYSVYVGGASAGSFTVDQFADPNIILYISGALLIFAFIIGVLFILRRRRIQ